MEGIRLVLSFCGSNSKREVRVTLPVSVFDQNYRSLMATGNNARGTGFL